MGVLWVARSTRFSQQLTTAVLFDREPKTLGEIFGYFECRKMSVDPGGLSLNVSKDEVLFLLFAWVYVSEVGVVVELLAQSKGSYDNSCVAAVSYVCRKCAQLYVVRAAVTLILCGQGRDLPYLTALLGIRTP